MGVTGRAGDRLRALLGVVLLGGLLAAGCSSSSTGSSAGPEPGIPSTAAASAGTPAVSTPSPQRTSTGDVVNDGYVFFWVAFINALAAGDPNFPDLTQRASGQALAFARDAVTTYRTEGWTRVVKDGYRIDSRVVQRQADTARVSDVQDWSKWPLVHGDNDEIVPGSTPRQCITAGLVRRNGSWIVDTLTFAPNTC